VKRCTVACDTPAGIVSCELQLADSASIEDALRAARLVLGEHDIGWDDAAVGVFGQLRTRTDLWRDAERIEVYRALQIDPRASRRQRANKKTGR
jgi:uncharacterized protein